ncbi:5'/3'-nucleotidase SurE [Haematospirillum sp. H1815]|uniref:5'/3'-nucleotidase SurE n=1 Tax=Haematospirillum sp. H1815 TaxID=2723108 RepID=UPI0014390C02|nr:5'/3'-nucleotidase SurE [Haematospirillum sp. H1815]NKD76483.1 5'/3'-nucleotidase SurE [Haematospirillum sp. H1815]
MHDSVFDLCGKRILVSNDDGIHGPGLQVLIRIARSLSDDVWVVVPDQEQSGSAHSLTLHHPLRIQSVSTNVWTVNGTPTDCVLLAVNHLMKDRMPDLVLSGVNRGANLGEDVTYSGTVAAAMEGTLLGIPSIALSQVFKDQGNIHWATAEAFGPGIIGRLMTKGWPKNVLMNVNFPDASPSGVTGVEAVRQGIHKLGDDLVERLDPRGRPYVWIGAQRPVDQPVPGTDVEAISRGAITVSPLCVDFTDYHTLEELCAQVLS